MVNVERCNGEQQCHVIAIKHVIQLIKQLIATASSSQLRAAVIQMQEKLTKEKKKIQANLFVRKEDHHGT